MFIEINMLRFLLIKCFTTCELIVHVYSKIVVYFVAVLSVHRLLNPLSVNAVIPNHSTGSVAPSMGVHTVTGLLSLQILSASFTVCAC
jgi:hypothetical protein